MGQECGCAPIATDEEIRKMNEWLRGLPVEGFPIQDNGPFYGYQTERAVISMEDLREYRAKNRLTRSERNR